MRRSSMLGAVVLAALFALLVAAPAGAAVTGTVCGQVTAFTPPTATNGSLTIDGTAEVINSSATAAIDLGTITTLNAIAAADATTCLDIDANGAEEIVDVQIAAQAEICGTAALDTTTGVFSVAGVNLPADILSADAELAALLDLAADADASVCVDVTIDDTTGLITTVALDATLMLCGDVALDADSATIAGADVPLSLLDAEAEALLALAVDAGADACVQLVVEDTELVAANVSADIDLCGEVTLDAGGNLVVDGVVVPDALLSADAQAMLELAAAADGTACALIDASSTGGDTTLGVTVTIDVCAEVTAITDGTVTLEGVELIFAGAAAADIEVGDLICLAAGTGPTGDGVVTDIDTTDDDDGVGAGGDGAGGDDDDLLPDTAATTPFDAAALGVLLLVASGIGFSAVRRLEIGRS